jgi:tetratricopeptide (TPR) repeat protein
MKYFAFFLTLLFVAHLSFAQSERKYIREGNKNYKDEKYNNSIVAYQKALTEDPTSTAAEFNLGDAFFKDKKYKEATDQFQILSQKEKDKNQLAKVYHNLGNSMLLQKKIPESIEAYKSALRNNPKDDETRWNLAYAQKLQAEQQKNQNKDKNKDQQDKDKQDKDKQDKDQQNKDQQNKDQQNKDQQNKDQQKQEQQKQNQQNQNQENKEDQNKDDPQKQGRQQMKISKEDAKRILEALKNEEAALQEKVKKEQARSKKVKTDKDW